jgi:spermidine synthase
VEAATRSAFVLGLGGAASALACVVWGAAVARAVGGSPVTTAVSAAAFAGAVAAGGVFAARVARRDAGAGRALPGLLLAGALWMTGAVWVAPCVDGAADRAPAGAFATHLVVALVALGLPGLIAGALVPLGGTLDACRGAARGGGRLWATATFGAALGFGSVGAAAPSLLGYAAVGWLASAVYAVAAWLACRLAPAGAAMVGSPGEGGEPEGRRGAGRSGRPAERRPGVGRGVVAATTVALGAGGAAWLALWTRQRSLVLPEGPAWLALLASAWLAWFAAGCAVSRRVEGLARRPETTLAAAALLAAAGGPVGAALGGWVRGAIADARPVPWLAAEAAVAVAAAMASALPTGVALPIASSALHRPDGGAASGAGPVVVWCAAGAIAGVVAAPFVAVPWFGLSAALVAVPVAVGLPPAFLAWRGGDRRDRVGARLVAATAAALVASLALAARVDTTPWRSAGGGGSVDEARAEVRVVWGADGVAVVVAGADGSRALLLDGHRPAGGDGGAFIERRLAHIPMLLHGHARTVAVAGVATGNTVGAFAAHPVRRIDAVESLGPALRALDLFGDTNGRLWARENVHLVHGDGRLAIRRGRVGYDLVVDDLAHSWRGAAAGLTSVQHFRAVRARLAPGGLYCLWVPLGEVAVGDLAGVAAGFVAVFAEATVLLGHLGVREPLLALVGGTRPPAELLERGRLWAALGERPPGWAVEADLAAPEDLQSLYVGDARWLADLGAAAVPSTLDRPLDAHRRAATWWRATDDLGPATLATVLARRRPLAEVLPDDENALRRHRAVGVLVRAGLAEAGGDLDGAESGYERAAEADPTFSLPELALALLREGRASSSRRRR